MIGRPHRVRGLAIVVGLLVFAAVPACTAETRSENTRNKAKSEQSLQQGIAWLLDQQAADGGWHSSTYGQMRCGVGNTALTLYSLSYCADKLPASAQPKIDLAIKFLLSNLDQLGFVRAASGESDYPTYATALLLSSLERLRPNSWQSERQRMRDYLIQMQMPESETDPDAGGWAPVGGDRSGGSPTEHANISATRFVLEALQRSGGVPLPVQKRALAFLSRCQNSGDPIHDGGFFFTPTADDPLNKAGAIEKNGQSATALSYGSATVDGLLSLAACGVSADDPRATAAIAWLRANPSIEHVPGVTSEMPSAYDGLRFYYYAALATLIRDRPADTSLADQLPRLTDVIVAEQRDGSWANPCQLMHEDDPLVATSLAIQALATCGKKN